MALTCVKSPWSRVGLSTQPMLRWPLQMPGNLKELPKKPWVVFKHSSYYLTPPWLPLQAAFLSSWTSQQPPLPEGPPRAARTPPLQKQLNKPFFFFFLGLEHPVISCSLSSLPLNSLLLASHTIPSGCPLSLLCIQSICLPSTHF